MTMRLSAFLTWSLSGCLLIQSGLSQTINVDIQPFGSPLYSGNDGILSGSGTYWNPGSGDNLNDENGAATTVDVSLVTTPGGFSSSGTPHALYDDSIVANRSYWLDYRIEGLDPYRTYDIAIYSRASGNAYTRLTAFDEDSQPYGVHQYKNNWSSGALPGLELYDYVRYNGQKPYENSTREYQIYVRVYPTSSTGGAFEHVVGMQIKPTGVRANIPPHYPTLISPTNNATGVSPSTVLSASDFSDPDPGDTLVNSQWQVDDDQYFSDPEWDSGESTETATSATIPTGLLTPGTSYFWRVRYKDSSGNWSPYTGRFSFTTGSEEPPAFSAEPSFSGINAILSWTSLAGHQYTLHHSTNLSEGFSVLESNITATAPMNSYTDTVDGVRNKYWILTDQ